MNEIEIMQLPNGIDGLIAELKPAVKIKWNFELRKYEVDNSDEAIAKQQAGCDLVKIALRDIYSFGEVIARGTPKFCLDLYRIFNNLQYVEDESSTVLGGYYSELNVKPSMGVYGREGENFTKLVGRLGLSSSAAYRYKDLGNFVDEQTGEFYTEFKGYSLSLLSEIWTYAVESYNMSAQKLKGLSKLIPADTKVVDIRAYRKVMKLKDKFKAPFDDFENRNKIDANKTKLPKVLKIYNELIQAAEAEKQKKELDSVQEQSEVIEYAGQLPRQTAMDLPEQTEQEEDNFSAYAEKSEPQKAPAPALMGDSELIDYCIKFTGGNELWKARKFRIQSFALNNPSQYEFLNFIKEVYWDNLEPTDRFAVVHGQPFSKLEFNDKFIITRATGGKICLHWASFVGNISRLIGADKYLSSEEKAEFSERQSGCVSVMDASEPSEEAEEQDNFSAYAENLSATELTPRHQQTNREYLATLPDESFVTDILLQIAKVYPLHGNSASLISTMRKRLIEWLNTPHEVQ